ncbi:hypothetical protein [Paenibacillus sp.]|uniref:hypothetical protein n=1 Tax=Paenibacillus sp. TaxID=58172 RepID=UPI002D43A57C|nr:hypothetical protein [Paenibacillus sp.]HZG58364.1 hypothetical protein [Paenibacillus sp.]
MSEDPRLGDWQFRFVADTDGGGGAMYWIMLASYNNRQRDILIDARTNEPLDVTGGDLDERDKQLLAEWAAKLLVEQLGGERPPLQPPPPAAGVEKDEEDDPLAGLLADDGGGGGNSGK